MMYCNLIFQQFIEVNTLISWASCIIIIIVKHVYVFFYIDIRDLSLLIVMPLYLHYIALQLEFLSGPDQMMDNSL